jgi:hypothetical protein
MVFFKAHLNTIAKIRSTFRTGAAVNCDQFLIHAYNTAVAMYLTAPLDDAMRTMNLAFKDIPGISTDANVKQISEMYWEMDPVLFRSYKYSIPPSYRIRGALRSATLTRKRKITPHVRILRPRYSTDMCDANLSAVSIITSAASEEPSRERSSASPVSSIDDDDEEEDEEDYYDDDDGEDDVDSDFSDGSYASVCCEFTNSRDKDRRVAASPGSDQDAGKGTHTEVCSMPPPKNRGILPRSPLTICRKNHGPPTSAYFSILWHPTIAIGTPDGYMYECSREDAVDAAEALLECKDAVNVAFNVTFQAIYGRQFATITNAIAKMPIRFLSTSSFYGFDLYTDLPTPSMINTLHTLHITADIMRCLPQKRNGRDFAGSLFPWLAKANVKHLFLDFTGRLRTDFAELLRATKASGCLFDSLPSITHFTVVHNSTDCTEMLLSFIFTIVEKMTSLLFLEIQSTQPYHPKSQCMEDHASIGARFGEHPTLKYIRAPGHREISEPWPSITPGMGSARNWLDPPNVLYEGTRKWSPALHAAAAPSTLDSRRWLFLLWMASDTEAPLEGEDYVYLEEMMKLTTIPLLCDFFP